MAPGEVIAMGTEKTTITKGAIVAQNAYTQKRWKIREAHIDETEKRGTGRDKPSLNSNISG